MQHGGLTGDLRERKHESLPFHQENPRSESEHVRVGEVPRLVHQHLLQREQPVGGDVPGD